MKDYILDLDKPRKLRYGFKALRLLRQKYGERSIESLMNVPVDELPVFAWAGLKWEDDSIKVEQVEGLLDEAIPEKYTIMGIIEVVMGAMAAQIGVDLKKIPAGDREKKTEKVEKKAEKPEPTGTIPSSRKPKK